MRHYSPASTDTVLGTLLEEPSIARGVVHHATIASRPGRYSELPPWLDERIRTGLASRGLDSRKHLHQAPQEPHV